MTTCPGMRSTCKSIEDECITTPELEFGTKGHKVHRNPLIAHMLITWAVYGFGMLHMCTVDFPYACHHVCVSVLIRKLYTWYGVYVSACVLMCGLAWSRVSTWEAFMDCSS